MLDAVDTITVTDFKNVITKDYTSKALQKKILKKWRLYLIKSEY